MGILTVKTRGYFLPERIRLCFWVEPKSSLDLGLLWFLPRVLLIPDFHVLWSQTWKRYFCSGVPGFHFPTVHFLVLIDRILLDGLWFVLLVLIFLTFLYVCDSFKMWWLEFIRHKYTATGGLLEWVLCVQYWWKCEPFKADFDCIDFLL